MNQDRRLKENIMKVLIWGSAVITVGILLWIVSYVVINGIGEINKEFLTTSPVGDEGGIYPMLPTTLYMVLLTIVIATPIGICAAIYLVEYAKPGKVVRIIRFATESLAGIPSIIFGLFGFIMFVTIFKLGWSILSGSLTLSIMILPTIVRTTEEALRSVPDTFRQGSLALGASKFRTILFVVLPCCGRGIISASILSIGRIVGETAAVFFTAGTVARVPSSINDSGRTLAVHLFIMAKESLSFSKAFATATVLILLVLTVNIITSGIGKRLKKY